MPLQRIDVREVERVAKPARALRSANQWRSVDGTAFRAARDYDDAPVRAPRRDVQRDGGSHDAATDNYDVRSGGGGRQAPRAVAEMVAHHGFGRGRQAPRAEAKRTHHVFNGV